MSFGQTKIQDGAAGGIIGLPITALTGNRARDLCQVGPRSLNNLIRSQSDRGVFVILDRRVLSKGYGSLILKSLPECTITSPVLADLPRLATDWLAADRPALAVS